MSDLLKYEVLERAFGAVHMLELLDDHTGLTDKTLPLFDAAFAAVYKLYQAAAEEFNDSEESEKEQNNG